MQRRKVKRNGINEIYFMVVVVVLGGVAFLYGYTSPQAKKQRQSRSEIVQLRLDKEASDYAALKEAEKADARYRGACIMPHTYVGNRPDWYPQAVIIQQGTPVISGEDGSPVKDGAVVCDDRGNTARVKRGIAVDAAYTGNGELINQRFADALGWHERAQRSNLSGN